MTEVRTNIQTDERKDENYIPVGINARGIISLGFVSLNKRHVNWLFCGVVFNFCSVYTETLPLPSTFKIRSI